MVDSNVHVDAWSMLVVGVIYRVTKQDRRPICAKLIDDAVVVG